MLTRLLCRLVGHRWLFVNAWHPSIEGVTVVKFCGRCGSQADR